MLQSFYSKCKKMQVESKFVYLRAILNFFVMFQFASAETIAASGSTLPSVQSFAKLFDECTDQAAIKYTNLKANTTIINCCSTLHVGNCLRDLCGHNSNHILSECSIAALQAQIQSSIQASCTGISDIDTKYCNQLPIRSQILMFVGIGVGVLLSLLLIVCIIIVYRRKFGKKHDKSKVIYSFDTKFTVDGAPQSALSTATKCGADPTWAAVPADPNKKHRKHKHHKQKHGNDNNGRSLNRRNESDNRKKKQEYVTNPVTPVRQDTQNIQLSTKARLSEVRLALK